MRNVACQLAVLFVLVLDSLATSQEPSPQPSAAESKFSAVLFTATGRYPHEVSAAYGDFTLAGPNVESLMPVPKGIRHVAYDADGKQLYGISNHDVYQIDLNKGQASEMKTTDDLPRLSWTCGIAFDTKRKRLIVATLGGVGYLYSFTPKTGQWAVISEIDNVDLAALTYDAQSDRLYGLCRSFGEEKPTIAIFNANGAVVDTMVLSDPAILPQSGHGPGARPVQLAIVGGELAVISESRISAVDLKSESVRITWTRK